MPIIPPKTPTTPTTALSCQNLIDGTNDRLMGYQNAVTSAQLLDFINEAKDEIWALLKNLHTEYFEQSTQNSDPTQLNFFPLDQFGNQLSGNSLQPNLRQYTLPSDLREVKFIEETLKGYEQTIYTYRSLDSGDFRSARRSSNVDATLTPSTEYFYAVSGKNQLVLAQYPEAHFIPIIWYIRSLPDCVAGNVLDEILFPYSKKIMDYSVKKVMLGLQDAAQFDRWQQQWREDLRTIETSASSRNQADIEVVEDFLG